MAKVAVEKKKYKVISGGWVDTRTETFYKRGSVVLLAPTTAMKFRNALEPVDPDEDVTKGTPVSSERLTEEDPAAPAAKVEGDEGGEEATVEQEPPAGAEDATDMFPNEAGAKVYQLPDGGLVVQVAGEKDMTFDEPDEVTAHLESLPKAEVEEEKPAAKKKPAKAKKTK